MKQEMKNNKLTLTMWKQYVLILLGSIPYSFGVSCFLSPNELAAGGVTGMSIILNAVTGIGVGSYILLLNIPVLILGLKRFGLRFLCSTIYALVCISTFSNIFEALPPISEDKILSAIAGGVLVALGMGLIFKCHATTGGIDILVKIMRQKYPQLKTGRLFLFMDSVVILTSAIVFRSLEVAIYAALAVFVTTITLDNVLYGLDEAMLIYIISNKPWEIRNRLIHDLDTGVTVLNGSGGFSGDKKQILLLVTTKKFGIKVEELVKEVDQTAFVIITRANEIYGEGYKNLQDEKI